MLSLLDEFDSFKQALLLLFNRIIPTHNIQKIVMFNILQQLNESKKLLLDDLLIMYFKIIDDYVFDLHSSELIIALNRHLKEIVCNVL